MAQTVVFDTNILVQAFVRFKSDHIAILHTITREKLRLGLDQGKGIRKEYENNLSGSEFYRKWIQEVEKRGQVNQVGKSDLPDKHKQLLKKYGCHEPSDHIFIGVAFHSDKILVSEDSDMGKGPKGHESPHPKALKYLTDNMGLTVYDAAEACHNLT